ncbi:G-type lectin S-receptor-like serine/threonine-protein kinase [Acorus calamus]|uniref:G-type lectin S-receptor-like serine/threonine-protein kinase n=1 Tax=Acorus calamus TaxID=4465 RepID=A0AAV9ENN3_ACOCL|nr:G-type lectin S-receptor-like serine/threonine-protein kinase [Acorus calamus]
MVEAAGPEETVIVVVDVDRSKNKRCSGDALKWALNNVVKPRDTVILLAVFSDYVRKSSSSSSASSSSTSCFSFSTGIGFSSIWERLEFSGAGEMEPEELEEEIKKRWEEYQSTLQHMNIYLQLILLHSHFKKDKDFIHRQVGCNVALMNKDGVTLKPAVVIDSLELSRHPRQEDVQKDVEQSKVPPQNYPCSRPLSCRPGFPQCVTKDELESITNSFSEENLMYEKDDLRVYRGILCDAPVLVKCFLGGSERFRSEIDILSRLTKFTCAKLFNYEDPNSGDESIKGKSTVEDEWLSLDVHMYGLFLLELLTGQTQSCESNGEYQFFMNQVLPQLEEDGSLNDVLDHRLVDLCECDEVRFMVGAALLCLKDHLNQRPTMSEKIWMEMVKKDVKDNKLALNDH